MTFATFCGTVFWLCQVWKMRYFYVLWTSFTNSCHYEQISFAISLYCIHAWWHFILRYINSKKIKFSLVRIIGTTSFVFESWFICCKWYKTYQQSLKKNHLHYQKRCVIKIKKIKIRGQFTPPTFSLLVRQITHNIYQEKAQSLLISSEFAHFIKFKHCSLGGLYKGCSLLLIRMSTGS